MSSFQYLKCPRRSFVMPIYNIFKIYNGATQLEMVSQRDRLLQEFVEKEIAFNLLNMLFFKKIALIGCLYRAVSQ